jgi:hypothetical protein
MIIIADTARPVLLTAKRSPRKAATLLQYAVDIEDLYRAMSDGSRIETISPPATWTFPETKAFIRAIVNVVLQKGADLKDDDDLFNHGLDRYLFVLHRMCVADLHIAFNRLSCGMASYIPSEK